jgi:5-formyltetrahydrofolate cyclo-ligase
MTEQKTALRYQMRARRNAISTEEQSALSHQICEHLRGFPRLQSASVVAAYLATRHEASLDEAITLWLENKTVGVPAVGLKPRFDILEDLQNVRTNARGLRVPLSERKIASHEADVILVPGLAFDLNGNRLGQGGGWYDRTLERARQKGAPLVIGVTFECQIVEAVPHENHDARIDYLVTETGIRVLDEERKRQRNTSR